MERIIQHCFNSLVRIKGAAGPASTAQTKLPLKNYNNAAGPLLAKAKQETHILNSLAVRTAAP